MRQQHKKSSRICSATILCLLMVCAPYTWAGKGGKGGGGGPSDRPGDTSLCATFADGDGDAIVSDSGTGDATYCDENDGAWLVSGMNGNFVAGEFGSKKFNPARRSVLFVSDCGGLADEACDPVNGVEVERLWTAYEHDADGNPVGNDRLAWTVMKSGDITRVSLAVKLGRTRDVAFGTPHGVQIACTADAGGADPAWISCNGEDADGACNSWTLSSFDLSNVSVPDNAQACLKRDGYADTTIDAHFSMELNAVP